MFSHKQGPDAHGSWSREGLLIDRHASVFTEKRGMLQAWDNAAGPEALQVSRVQGPPYGFLLLSL